MNEHLFTPDRSKTIQMEITPESAGWTYLSFAIVGLKPGERHDHLLTDQETAVVPLSGSARVKVGDLETTLSRTSVFDEMPRVAYAPPGTAMEILAADEAFGSAGMAQSTNHHDVNAVLATDQGYRQSPLQNFFLERYTASYLDQWEAFVDAVENGGPTPISGADGRAPLIIGMAAKRSMDEGRPVPISEIVS